MGAGPLAQPGVVQMMPTIHATTMKARRTGAPAYTRPRALSTLGSMSDLSTRTAEEIAFLRGLRQIRQLKPDPLPQAALDDILEVARWTGSARNIQPWDLVLIHD